MYGRNIFLKNSVVDYLDRWYNKFIGKDVDIMSKQEVLNVINSMPDDVSFDDVLYNLYMMNNIKAGLSDIKSGRTISHEGVKRMFM